MFQNRRDPKVETPVDKKRLPLASEADMLMRINYFYNH